MDTTQLKALACWRLANGHRILWRVWFAALLAVAFIVLIIRGNAEDPRKNYVESHKALLSLAPPPVPDDENAALDYRKAFAAYVSPAGTPNRYDPEMELTRESAFFETPEFAAFYASESPYFDLLDAATDKTRCSWDLNYSSGMLMTIGHFGSMRHAARLLCVRARVHAHAGDHQAAANDFKRINTLAEHLSNDKVLLAGLVMISIRAIEAHTLQSILLHDTPTKADDIAAYRDAMKPDAKPDAMMVETFKSEAVMSAETLDRLALQEDSKGTTAAALGTSRLMLPAWSLFYGSERKTQRAVTNEIEANLKDGKFIVDYDELLRRNMKGPSFMYSAVLPSYSRVQQAYGRDINNRLCIDTTLAVLQFRAKYRRDPKALEELVSEFLPAVPVDCVRKMPLKILVEKNEIDIWKNSFTRGYKLQAGSLRISAEALDDTKPEKIIQGASEVFFLPPMKK